MQYFVFLATLILIPVLLCLVDRKVKGCRSVLVKLLSMVVVTTFILLGVYFYGQQILATFRINMKSLTSMKAFFSSRLLIYFLFLILVILVSCKFVFTLLVLRSENRIVTKGEKTFFLAAIVFDLALIPNIFVNNALFALFVATTLIEIGLVYTKLVFSISYKEKDTLVLGA